jgi:succinate dehydrogenase / fumarate reductase cytochrome b subunit
MVCLGFHLWHGIWSLTQTLGLAHPRYDALRRTLSMAFAVLVVLGFMAVPIGVLAGLIDVAPALTAASPIAR